MFSKFDPRTKILIVLMFTILVFIVNLLPAAFFLLIFFLALRIAVKIPFRGGKYIKNLSLLVTFLILLQTLLAPGTHYILKPLFPPSFPLLGGLGSLKWEGLQAGFIIGCRLVVLLLVLPILSRTTEPLKIAGGLCCFGINYRVSFIISTAFNLIPVFEEEARSIIDAQKLRGSNLFEKGSIFSKLKAYPGLVIPLMLGAMRKAQAAGLAMDSRAFGIYRNRTWIDKPSMKMHDFLAIFLSLAFCAAVLFINFR